MPIKSEKSFLKNPSEFATFARSIIRSKNRAERARKILYGSAYPGKVANLSLASSKKQMQRKKQSHDHFRATRLIYGERDLGLDRLKSLERGLVVQLRQAREKITELQKKQSRLETMGMSEHKENETLMKKIQDLETIIAERDETIMQDKMKFEKASHRIELLEEMSDMHVAKIRELEAELEQKEVEVEESLVERDKLILDYKSVKTLYQRSEMKSLQGDAEITSLQRDKNSLKNRLLKVQESCNNIKAKYGLVDHQIAALLDENKSLDEDKRDLQEAIDEYRKENNHLQDELESVLLQEIEMLQLENAYFADGQNPVDLEDKPKTETIVRTVKFGLHGDDISLKEDGTVACRSSSNHPSWQTVLVNSIVQAGVHSYTFRLDDLCGDGDIMMGIIQPDAVSLTSEIGTCKRSYALFLGDGTIYHQGQESQYDEDMELKNGDLITMTLDFNLKQLSFTVNGVSRGIAVDNLPVNCSYSAALSFGDEGKYTVTYLQGQSQEK